MGFDLSDPCAACGATDPQCGDMDGGCCDACRDTAGCTHATTLTTHPAETLPTEEGR